VLTPDAPNRGLTVILIVDDHTDTTHPLRLLLKRHGYDAEAVSSGDEALRRMRADRPQLVMLDVMMPGMSGMQVLRSIKADPELRDIPVIMYSAGINISDKEEARKLGAREWLTKGQVKWKDLVSRIEQHAGAPA
jgi:twitching motility two-component system response regulator PilH